MKKYTQFLLLFSALFFASCERPNTDEEFPFEIKLVIRAVLEPGKTAADIYIGRTLPVADRFNQPFANITNASAAILYNGGLYPLRHTQNGLYRNDTLRLVAGGTYTLVARWEDKTATAETYIPKIGSVTPPGIRSTTVNGRTVKYLESSIFSVNNESYVATWAVLGTAGNISTEAKYFGTIFRGRSGGTITTTEYPSSVQASELGMRVYVYDGAYYDYFNTQDSVQNTDAVFSQPKTNVKWNVSGDGIGLFLGRRDTLVKVR